MKILYGIQGTGHGHISRAREIIPLLSQYAELDVLISGYNCQMNLEGIELIQKRGISLAYDSNGRVSYLKTALQLKPISFITDIQSIHPEQYDLIISDYEPVTAWASINSQTPTVALSHQASFLSKKSPRPVRKSLFAEQILSNFAPCKSAIGFHFQRYDKFILPPVIRKEVQGLEPVNGKHITVYLPAFDHHKLIPLFKQFRSVDWHLFSPLCKEIFSSENVHVHPVGNKPFLNSLKTSSGVVAGAGFETCAEAMFLGKKLLAIPISNQYEQLCNAASLEKLGVMTWNGSDLSSFSKKLSNWLEDAAVVNLREIADTEHLTKKLIRYTKLKRGRFSPESPINDAA